MNELNFLQNKTIYRNIKTKPFYKDLVIVYDTKKTVTDNDENNAVIKKETFVTHKDNLNNINNIDDIIDKNFEVNGFYHNTGRLKLLNKEIYHNILHGDYTNYDDKIVPFDEDKYLSDNYMPIIYDIDNLFTDLDGNYLPMPIHITDNILDGYMTNAHYDLDAVINRLKDEPTVFALGTMPYNRDIKVPLEVKTIPIYNQMDKADKMLDFYIVPSQDLYNIYISKGMDDRGWFLETMYGIKKNLVLERTIYGKIKLQ